MYTHDLNLSSKGSRAFTHLLWPIPQATLAPAANSC